MVDLNDIWNLITNIPDGVKDLIAVSQKIKDMIQNQAEDALRKVLPEGFDIFNFGWLWEVLVDIKNTLDNFQLPDLSGLDDLASGISGVADGIVNRMEAMFKSVWEQLQDPDTWVNGPLTDELVDFANQELEKIKDEQSFNEVRKNWYPQIDWSPFRDYEYYHTIKIRKAYEKAFMPRGYPIRFHMYVGYFSSIGIFIPDGWVVYAAGTNLMWREKPSTRWRKVKIMYIGQEFWAVTQQFIPLQFESAIQRIIAMNAAIDWPIWENLGFYNTANDNVIKANWDKVKLDLMKIVGLPTGNIG